MLNIVIPLIVFLFPLAYSPGPGNMFFAANGARFGFRSTIPSNTGYHIATWIVTVAIGLGFSVALENYPNAFLAIKIAGSLYVFWIAWNLFKSGALEGSEQAKPATFVDGVVLLILNPKAYLIIALMFTQFLGSSDGERITAVIVISTIFTINNLVAFSLWAAVGDRIASRFRTEKGARRLNMIFGVTLAAVAVWMLVS
jgi:threonine/homoserine/homoserine lactone efflux protein